MSQMKYLRSKRLKSIYMASGFGRSFQESLWKNMSSFHRSHIFIGERRWLALSDELFTKISKAIGPYCKVRFDV